MDADIFYELTGLGMRRYSSLRNAHLDEIAQQIYTTQSTENITYSDEISICFCWTPSTPGKARAEE